MGLRDLYFAMEDKYYRFLDKVEKVIPIYKIVDPIDKVFPSFILFLILLILLLAWIVLAIFPIFFVQEQSTFNLLVVDSEGNSLSDVSIIITAEGQSKNYNTDNYGKIEELKFKKGIELTISATKQGFKESEETVALDDVIVSREITLETETGGFQGKQYTLRFRNQFNQPITDNKTISFYCTGNANPPSEMTTIDDEITVTEPPGCNGLLASVSIVGYQDASSIPITRNPQTITMIPLTLPEDKKATIRALVKFNGQYIAQDIIVSLQRSNNAGGFVEEEQKVSNNGPVSFEVSPGTYKLSTVSTTRFGSKESSSFDIGSEETKDVMLDLVESTTGKITIFVVDKSTGQAIDHAIVRLMLGTNEVGKIWTSTAYDRNGKAEFFISENGPYYATATQESYCFGRLDNLQTAPNQNVIALNPLTPACGGTVKIKVIDETGKNVPNAVTTLYTEDGYSAGYDKKITDLNGETKYPNVANGNYKAFAFKGTLSGWSDAQSFTNGLEDTTLTVTMVIPNSQVKIRAIDQYGEPLQFAEVALVDTFDGSYVGGGYRPVEDVNGIITFDVKADKRVYVLARKTDTSSGQTYTNYMSPPFDLIPNSTTGVEVKLLKEIISGDIKIEFDGLYKNGAVATVLSPNEEYEARFKLLIPTSQNYSKIGMHFRTGNSNIMEKDKIFIKDVIVPATRNIMKATAFNPPNHYEDDSKTITNEDAKWATIEWQKGSLVNKELNSQNKLMNGIVEVRATVKVTQNAMIGEELPVYFRAYGVRDSQYLRDPVDEELGTAESNAVKQALYANTHLPKIYEIGIQTICSDKFCFSSTIQDVEADVVENVTDTYSAKIFQPYKLNFTIVNNSEFDSDIEPNALIKISNPDQTIRIQKYNITGSQNRKISGSPDNYDTDWIETGTLGLKDSITGTIEFSPQKSGSGVMLIQIKSLQRLTFDKTITIMVEAANDISATIIPQLLPSGIENTITIHAIDAKTGLDLNGAMVKILDNAKNVIITTTTSSIGIAKITLPAQKPAEILFARIEKPGYKVFELQINVDDKIIEPPSAIGLSLNPKSALEAGKTFSVKNLTGFDLKIKSIEINGDFKGYLDEGQMNGWLSNFANATIAGKQTSNYSLKGILSESGKRIENPTAMDGTLTIVVEGFDSEWSFTTPVRISIGLGDKVDDPTCFSVSKTTWTARTENKPVSIEFELQNNCTVAGSPIILKNLSAKVLWIDGSNHIGTFSFKTLNYASELRAGYSRIILPSMEQGRIAAVLTFTPDNGVNGEAKANIIFEALNPTDAGNEVLGGESTGKIAANIFATSLETCINIDKDTLSIKKTSKDSFTIETKNCGVPTDIRIDSDLTLSQKRLTLQSTDKKEIEVLAEKNYAGMYPLFIYARSLGDTDYKIMKVVRTIIQPDGCIELSKYEFDIYDDPSNPFDGFDTAVLTNKCYNEQDNIKVTIKANKLKAFLTGAVLGALAGWGLQELGGLGGNTAAKPPAGATTKDGYSLGISPSDGTIFNNDDKIKLEATITKGGKEAGIMEISWTAKYGSGPTTPIILTPITSNTDDAAGMNGMPGMVTLALTEQTTVNLRGEITAEYLLDKLKLKNPPTTTYNNIAISYIAKAKGRKEGLEPLTATTNISITAKGISTCIIISPTSSTPITAGQNPLQVIINCKNIQNGTSNSSLSVKLNELPCALNSTPVPNQTFNATYNCTGVPETEGKIFTVEVAVEDQEPYVVHLTTKSAAAQAEGYTLTMASSPPNGGTVAKNPDKQTYSAGEPVNISATTNQGFSFTQWTSTCPVLQNANENPTIITMASQNCTITANFIPTSGTEQQPTGELTVGGVRVNNGTNVTLNQGTSTPATVSCKKGTTDVMAININWTATDNTIANVSQNLGNNTTINALKAGQTTISITCEAHPVISFLVTVNATSTGGGGGTGGGATPPAATTETISGSPTTSHTISSNIAWYRYVTYTTNNGAARYRINPQNNVYRKPAGPNYDIDTAASWSGETQITTDSANGLAADKIKADYLKNTTFQNVIQTSSSDFVSINFAYNSTQAERYKIDAQNNVFKSNMLTLATPATIPVTGEEAAYVISKKTGALLPSTSAFNSSALVSLPMLEFDLGGGLIGGQLFGTMSNAVQLILGKPNPWTYGIIGGLVGYFTAKDQTINKTVLENDVILDANFNLLMAEFMKGADNLLREDIATDISLQNLGEPVLEPKVDDATGKLSIEKREIGFVNSTNLIQDDPIMPIFRMLKVNGKRPNYTLEYVNKNPGDYELSEDADKNNSTKFAEKFHLVFNSYKALDCVAEGEPNPNALPLCPKRENPNCVLGNMVGYTGEKALLKINYKWSWSDIGVNACDETNPSSQYCDATQFNLSLMQKIKAIKDFVENNNLVKCPSGSTTERTQSLDNTRKDLGLTKIQVIRKQLDANVVVTIENTNTFDINATPVFIIKNSSGTALNCDNVIGKVNVRSKTVVGCELANLSNGTYDVNVSLEGIQLCGGCENSLSSNDKISTQFIKEEQGVEKCEPYTISSDRLKEFLEANGIKNAESERILSYLNYNAFLMREGFTEDFRKDFDDYSKNVSFFGTPSWYYDAVSPNADSVSKIFNSSKFKFDFPGAPYANIEAGKYNVQLSIDFNNSTWKFFENGESDVTVNVKLRELQRPMPDSPLYYLPFDGRIGLDSENGRQGYGVNFREISSSTFKINKDPNQLVTTTNRIGSTPVNGGWVQAGVNNSFSFVNVDNRGILLDIQKLGQGDTQMVFSPSNVTPVMMKISREKTEKASAFYSIELDNSPQTDSPKLLAWTGVGYNCRDFTDNAVLTNYQNTYDLPALNSSCSKMAGDVKQVSYGLEWCNPTRSGSVFLETVVFTPQGKRGLLKMNMAQDSAGFTTSAGYAQTVELTNNNTPTVDAVQDILDLVKTNKVCVIGSGNRNSTKFFWNPAEFLSALSGEAANAETQCIGTVQQRQ